MPRQPAKFTSGRLTSLGMALLCACGMAEAEIFKYMDANGVVLFSDEPVKGPYKLIGTVDMKGMGATISGSRPTAPKFDSEAYRKRVALYSPLINATARLVQLKPELLHAVVRAESGYNPDAVSRAGAVGLMQLMPGTADRYGISNRNDPAANLRGGAYYLRDLVDLFKGDLKLAVAAYNAGENAVIDRGNTIPPFPETVEYVRRVMSYYQQNLQPKLAASD